MGETNVDLTQIFAIITKGGPAAIILAVAYGLAMLVREVRGGKLSDVQKADLTTQVALLKSQVAVLTESMAKMENEVERAFDLIHAMRYQRDQARIRVEYLEQLHDAQPRTVWPPEPQLSAAGLPPGLNAAPPASPTMILPPLPPEPQG